MLITIDRSTWRCGGNSIIGELMTHIPVHGDYINDDFRSPAFKRGVKDAKLELEPHEMSAEYLKGYASIRGYLTLRSHHEISEN